MADELAEYFDNPSEQRAYEEFCASQERGLADFQLDNPALVCRWRMANKKVPLLNRHIRALAARRVQGAPLTHNMLSWAKQHVEWSLAEGSYAERDGVLMLVIDVNGNAAMTVGAYECLADASREALAARAAEARTEAAETGVAPEVLGAVADGRVLLAAATNEPLCGAASLLAQVAQVRGHELSFVLSGEGADACAASRGADVLAAVQHADASALLDALRAAAHADSTAAAEPALFLVSDEHGVVPCCEEGASPLDAELVATLAADCRKLFS